MESKHWWFVSFYSWRVLFTICAVGKLQRIRDHESQEFIGAYLCTEKCCRSTIDCPRKLCCLEGSSSYSKRSCKCLTLHRARSCKSHLVFITVAGIFTFFCLCMKTKKREKICKPQQPATKNTFIRLEKPVIFMNCWHLLSLGLGKSILSCSICTTLDRIVLHNRCLELWPIWFAFGQASCPFQILFASKWSSHFKRSFWTRNAPYATIGDESSYKELKRVRTQADSCVTRVK